MKLPRPGKPGLGDWLAEAEVKRTAVSTAENLDSSLPNRQASTLEAAQSEERGLEVMSRASAGGPVHRATRDQARSCCSVASEIASRVAFIPPQPPQTQYVMSTQPSARPYQLYPAYCFRESPTFNTWVKITAADLHNLQEEPHFSGQHIYFHLNHPIRYVRLVGVVVAIDDITTKYTMITIDDGSGANIDLKIERIPPAEQNPVDTSSNTIIENVDIISRLGIFEIMIDGRMIDIGTVVKVKGTISEFRGNKQVDLKRIWAVPTTNEEAQAWAETAAFKLDVLSKPWQLTARELHRIEKRIKAEKKKMREYQRRQLEHRAKREEQRKVRKAYMKQREAKLEVLRLKEERILNAGALI